MCIRDSVCDVPVEGRYRVLIDAIPGPDCGKVRLLQDVSGQDHTVDLYACLLYTSRCV